MNIKQKFRVHCIRIPREKINQTNMFFRIFLISHLDSIASKNSSSLDWIAIMLQDFTFFLKKKTLSPIAK